MNSVLQNRMAFARATTSFGLGSGARPTLSTLQSLIPSSYQRQALRRATTPPDNASYWDLNRLFPQGQHRVSVSRGDEEWVLEKDPKTGMIVRSRFEKPTQEELLQLALTLGLLPMTQPSGQNILAQLSPLQPPAFQEGPDGAPDQAGEGLQGADPNQPFNRELSGGLG